MGGDKAKLGAGDLQVNQLQNRRLVGTLMLPLTLGAHQGTHANTALFVALARKLIDKEVISTKAITTAVVRMISS
jgi:hypothetical protein